MQAMEPGSTTAVQLYRASQELQSIFFCLLYHRPAGRLLLLICSRTSKVLRHLIKFQPGIAHAALFVFGQAAEIGVTVS